MKRTCLSLLLLATIIVGSGASTAMRARNQPVLSFMFWGDAAEYRENVAATKEAARSLGVQVKNIQSGNYDTDLPTRIAARNAPDIFYVADWRLAGFASKGVLLNLDPYLAKDPTFKRSDYTPQSLEGLTYKGHLYGLPRGFSASVLYYNKDIFDQMHVAYPSAKWTMTDLLDAAKKLTTKDHWGLMLHSGPGASDKPTFNWFLWQYGTDWLNPAGTQCTLTDPKAQSAFQYVLDLTYKYHVSPTATEISASGGWSGSVFTKGKAAMVMGPQRWFYLYAPLLGTDAPKFHWSVQLPPLAVDGKHRYSYPGYAGMGIWTGSKYPELAFKVGSAISKSVGQRIIAGVGSDMPAFLPALHSSAINIAPDRQADRISVDALQYTRIPHYPENMAQIQSAIDHDLANLWDNKDTVANATKTLCGDINPLLK